MQDLFLISFYSSLTCALRAQVNMTHKFILIYLLHVLFVLKIEYIFGRRKKNQTN